MEAELAAGTRFELVLFDSDGSEPSPIARLSTDGAVAAGASPAGGRTVWPADWVGVRRAVAEHHPRIAAKIQPHWPDLQVDEPALPIC